MQQNSNDPDTEQSKQCKSKQKGTFQSNAKTLPSKEMKGVSKETNGYNKHTRAFPTNLNSANLAVCRHKSRFLGTNNGQKRDCAKAGPRERIKQNKKYRKKHTQQHQWQ